MTSAQDYQTQTTALLTALMAAVVDPLDQIRLLSNMASLDVPSTEQGAVMSASITRRLSLVALAEAVSNYEPTSSTEARRIADRIDPIFEAETRRCADASHRTTYRMLRRLRTAVMQHLQQRGSQLPELVTHTFHTELPAAVIANMIYGDYTRADELVRRNEPVVHPLFMPRRIESLAI